MEQVLAKQPVHLWIVGALATLWNAFGSIDYVMSRTHNPDWIKLMMPGFEPATVYAYMDAMPYYASAGWALGVWGGLVGSLLMVMRSRHAVLAYLVSLVGMALSFGDQFLLHPAPAGMNNPIIPLMIVAIGIGLFLYARAMTARGVLR